MSATTQAPAFTDPRARMIGKRIRAKRTSLKLTQTALARAAGVDQGSVSAWERGRKLPTHTSLNRLRKALGLTDDEFLEWIEVAS